MLYLIWLELLILMFELYNSSLKLIDLCECLVHDEPSLILDLHQFIVFTVLPNIWIINNTFWIINCTCILSVPLQTLLISCTILEPLLTGTCRWLWLVPDPISVLLLLLLCHLLLLCFRNRRFIIFVQRFRLLWSRLFTELDLLLFQWWLTFVCGCWRSSWLISLIRWIVL